MFISALALSAIILTGGALSPNAPAADAAGLAHCTKSHYVTLNKSVYVSGLGWVLPGLHLPALSTGSRQCKNDRTYEGTALDSVKVIQNAANSSVYKRGITKDGKYGQNTAAAVKHIQVYGGLPKSQQDSVYGPVTCSRTWWPVQTPRLAGGGIWHLLMPSCSW
jgi:peptidoglycan hydrolase-like protein with peptidoglycan-binding domain